MTLDTRTITQRVQSHLSTTGRFTFVARHEPKSAQTVHGPLASIFFTELGPPPANSSLNMTDVVIRFTVRLYANMLTEPQDEIDDDTLRAVDAVFELVHGDFTLGGAVDFVDLLGQAGDPMRAESGYIELGGTMFRIVDITLPCVINDVWTQAR